MEGNVKKLKEIAKHPLALKNWYLETFPLDFIMEYHSHPQIEIMYCQKGGFDFVYRKDKNTTEVKSVFIGSKSLILVNTGYYHRIANLLPSTRIANLEFISNPSNADNPVSKPLKQLKIALETLAMACPKLQKIITRDKDFYIFSDNGTVLSTMKEIINTTIMPDNDEKSLSIALLTSKLFIDISRCNSPDIIMKTGIIHVDKALMYINSHYMEKISVEEIALAANVSKVYLQKLFKIEYGKTVHDVVLEKRIIQAKYLLEHTNLTVAEIAKQSGFVSRERLANIFKKIEGISPLSYRATAANKIILHFSNTGEVKIPNTE